MNNLFTKGMRSSEFYVGIALAFYALLQQAEILTPEGASQAGDLTVEAVKEGSEFWGVISAGVAYILSRGWAKSGDAS